MLDLALDNRIVINTKLEAALQELDILFSTNNTELLGDTNYGTNFEAFLWNFNTSLDEIERYAIDKLDTTYYVRQFGYNVNVEEVEGEFRSIYVLHINLFLDNGETVERSYNFQ